MLTIISVPFSASFHLYSAPLALNRRDLDGVPETAARGSACKHAGEHRRSGAPNPHTGRGRGGWGHGALTG